MKTLFLFTLTVILALNLNARENPFEPTDVFEDEVGKIVQMDENSVKKSMEETPYIKEMQEKMSNVTGQNKNKVEENIDKAMPVTEQKAYSKKEVDSLIQKTQKQITNDLIQFKPILLKLQDKDEKEISLNYATYLSFISKKIDELSKSSSLKKLEFIVDNSNKIVKFATLKLGLIVAIGVIVLQALSMYKT